nr:hypothetical protein Iba_chr04dCG17190 [Ipomoea batatas]
MAPATVASVPKIFAWLRILFIFTFSSLKMHAIINVMAGRTLHIAAAKVAVVYFIPIKYRFWSITGLLLLRSTSLAKIASVIFGLCFLSRIIAKGAMTKVATACLYTTNT